MCLAITLNSRRHDLTSVEHYVEQLRWKVTKLNNGVRGKTITPLECSVFWENVSVFNLCVIINLSFLRRYEIGMVLAFLTSSNSLLKLHIFGIYKRINRLKWSLYQNVCLDNSYWFVQVWSCKYAHETLDRQKAWIWTYVKFVHVLPLRRNCSKSRQKTLSVFYMMFKYFQFKRDL